MRIKVRISAEGKAVPVKLRRFEKNFLTYTRTAGKQTNKDLVQALKASMKDGEWQHNEEKYLKWKSYSGYSTMPLFRTSLLYNSISQELKLEQDGLAGRIGWHEGARYPGELKGKVWKGRVPNRRRKLLAPPSGPHGPRLTSHDTNYLAQVAYWNEHGEGGIYKRERVARRVKNGRFRNRQKYRNRYYDKIVVAQYGRIARPFVEAAFNESDLIPVINFQTALGKTLNAIFGRRKGNKGMSLHVNDIPF